MTGPRVFFRADADRRIGTGHIARCRCLARGLLKRGVPSTFLVAGPSSPVTESLEREGFEVLTLSEGPSDEAVALAAAIWPPEQTEHFSSSTARCPLSTPVISRKESGTGG